MMEKLISSAKSLFGSHMGMMILCCLAMVVAFVGISSVQFDTGGLGTYFILVPMAVCLGMHFFMHRSMGHGGHEDGQEDHRQAAREEPGKRLDISKPKRPEDSSPWAS